MPQSLLFKDHEITLVEPLYPKECRLRASTTPGRRTFFQAESPIKLLTDGKITRFAIRGRNFLQDVVSVQIGPDAAKIVEGKENLLIVETSNGSLSQASQIVIKQGTPSVVTLLPIEAPPKEKDLAIAGEVRQGESLDVVVSGRLVPEVEKVFFETSEVKIVSRDGNNLRLRLPESITAKSGRRQLTAQLKKKEGDEKIPTSDLIVDVLPLPGNATIVSDNSSSNRGRCQAFLRGLPDSWGTSSWQSHDLAAPAADRGRSTLRRGSIKAPC